MLQVARRVFGFVVYLWELAQVELHGRISSDRVRKLQSFLAQTSFLKAAAVCVMFPLRCVLMLAILESIPLAPTDEGTIANYAFWLRHILTLAALTPGGLSIFQSLLPELEITRTTTITLSILAGLASSGFAFAFSFLTGFPVPFTLLVCIPGWFLAVLPPTICIYITRHDSTLLWLFIRCWLLLVCLATILVVYPIYVFGFLRLGSVGQVFYVGVFPLLKIISRNGVSWLVGDFYDVKAGIVIFNIEVCSALYMSVAMQSSAKLTTTFAALAVDAIQTKVAISDINKMLTTFSDDLVPRDRQVISNSRVSGKSKSCRQNSPKHTLRKILIQETRRFSQL